MCKFGAELTCKNHKKIENMIGTGNEEELSKLLQKVNEISENTDAWGGWWTTPLTVLTIFASVATICGLFMIFKEMRMQKASMRRQELIVKDLIRHVLVNAAIMEVIRMKMAGQWGKVHPIEGVFTRFCVLDTDLQLSQIRVKDEQYTKLHSLSLFLRNYNIMSQLAEKHFNDPHFDPKEKELELDELWRRTVRITEEFLELGEVAELKINKECVQKFIIDHYNEKKAKRQKPLPDIQLPPRTGDCAYYDCNLDLSDTFDFCILDRYDDIRVIPFKNKSLRSIHSPNET